MDAPFFLNTIVRITTLTTTWFVARAIAIVIKEISDPRWSGYPITNAITAVVIDPIGRIEIERTIVKVQRTILKIKRAVIKVQWTVLKV